MTIRLDVPAFVGLTPEQYVEFCRRNPELRIERTHQGEIIVMPPTGGETGHRNSLLVYRLQSWAEHHGGRVFDSSTGFALPNGAQRSPDASWVSEASWQALSPQARQAYPPLCPFLVVELRSASDSRASLQDKMREYIENGAQLGWLLDPIVKEVEVFRGDGSREVLASPTSLSGEPVLPGLTLSLRGILD